MRWSLVRTTFVLDVCTSLNGLHELGDFASTAAAIAVQVGIITVPSTGIMHLDDLPKNLPLEDIPLYDDDKANNGKPLTALVISGPELMTMTDSQWKQISTVGQRTVM